MAVCRDTELGMVCYVNAEGAKQTLFANKVYDAYGVVISTYYTEADGTVVDTSAGAVSVGQCPVPSPDVEWSGSLCDVDPTTNEVIERYVCRTITTFDENCEVIDPVQVDLFLTDKVTPYVPVGEEKDCSICETETPLGLITDLSLLQ